MHAGAAATLLAEVAATPGAPIIAGISGVGGCGKSALLGDLEATYRDAGMPVWNGRTAEDAAEARGRGVVLVDDAHELNEARLTRIHSLVGEGDVSLIVAFRPWPRPPALGRLERALGRHRPTVNLGVLSPDEIAVHATTALGSPAPSAVVRQIAELTGGMPWLVHRLLGSAPGEVVEQLGFELESVGEQLRTLLLALTVGFDLAGRMPPTLEQGDESVYRLTTRARSAGLLLPDGGMIPIVRRALLQTTPHHQLRELQHALVDSLAADGNFPAEAARQLAREGLKDSRVAATLEHAGDSALDVDPALASTLYGEAASAGCDDIGTAARRAQAAAATGDLNGAGHIVDGLLSSRQVPDLVRGVDVAAELWARRGMLARSAEAYRWLQPARAGSSAALAAVAMIGTGDREGADSMLAARPGDESPTLLAVAVNLMGEGIRDSVSADPSSALPTLIRASDTMTAAGIATVPVPETPAALAAVVALQSGELGLADSIIEAALAGGQGGSAAVPRLALLGAWSAMLSDRPRLARAAIVQATAGESELAPRDALLLNALEVGLARRSDDGPALIRAWKRARERVLHVDTDLYNLLPLGELMIAAARLRDSSRLDTAVARAWALLARLGNPPLWSVPLHWSAVQAGILAERPSDLGPHAAALVHAAERHHLAAVLSAAGRAWIAVLGGETNVSQVESAARGLASVGMTWDGSRLAGHAAPHAKERKDMARLLACARDLHPGSASTPSPGWSASADSSGSPGTSASPIPTERTRTRGATAAVSQDPVSGVRELTGAATDEKGLSAREREVARLVLDGKTYREIGEAIFISPRTAEHHIARIRQRLGASSRSELLVHLRLALDDDAAPAH
jgi:DNA-binding CsgD family transcriptional regulator